MSLTTGASLNLSITVAGRTLKTGILNSPSVSMQRGHAISVSDRRASFTSKSCHGFPIEWQPTLDCTNADAAKITGCKGN